MNSKIIGFAIEARNKVNHMYDGKPYSVHLSMVAMYVSPKTKCPAMSKFASLGIVKSEVSEALNVSKNYECFKVSK